MTESEIEAAWIRWAHRQDIDADISDVRAFAQGHTNNRILIDGVTYLDTIAAAPQAYLSAGLIYIHDLAQDDESLQRELAMFDNAISGWMIKRSVENGPARPKTGVI